MKDENVILFLGDVLPYKPFTFRNRLKTIINLECPVIKGGEPVSGKINLSVRETYLNSIFGSQLFYVNLSNNHILDYGIGGLESTLGELEKLGIGYFGINRPVNERHNPLIIDFLGEKIGFISAISESTSPVVEVDDFNYLMLAEPENLLRTVRGIRPGVSRLVLYMHWGIEESSLPSASDVLFARKLIDAGVDLIVGSHAHAPQPVERYRNGIIAYNLGNFIMPSFDSMPSYYNEDGIPQSDYTKKLMLWNRISWGLAVDMKSMEFRIKKFMFIANRIIEPAFTPLDRYIDFHYDPEDPRYGKILHRHLIKRSFYRRLRNSHIGRSNK